jgi:outer membrane biosynthesis protein TonB
MDSSIRSRSAILTLVIHGAIFLILLFSLMTTTIPPFPEAGGGGGVLVNIGVLDEASGDIQPMSENITEEPFPEKVIASKAEEEKIATQDFEEAPVVKENNPEKKVTPVKTETKKAPVEKKVTEPKQTVDKRALYPGKTTTSKSQGTGTGAGDQGDPAGDPLSKYTGKGGNGTGASGTGTGGGDGSGSGSGKGVGSGVSFSLSGRHMVRTPQVNDKSQETGKVVVDITVDKDGNVASAIPGGRGSTTTSALLYKLAKDAALKAKFNAGNDDAEIQKGTITFVFLVQ